MHHDLVDFRKNADRSPPKTRRSPAKTCGATATLFDTASPPRPGAALGAPRV